MIKKSLEQERIFEEIKNGTGNILINAKAGTGKCLGKDTYVIMFDGTRKYVQDIVAGDLLMGDDGTARTVLSTSQGRGKLYKIMIPLTRETFVCNGDHILTCTTHKKKILPVDISVDEILKTRPKFNPIRPLTYKDLFLYKFIPSYNENKKYREDNIFYEMGHKFFNTRKITYDMLINVPPRYRHLIMSGLIDNYFYPQKDCFKAKKEITRNKDLFKVLLSICSFVYNVRNNSLYGDFSKLELRNKDYDGYYDKKISIKKTRTNVFKFYIKEYQENGKYYGFTLDGNGRFLVDNFIVTHNTTTIVNSLELIEEDKSIMMLAFNKHIASELKERVPNRDNLRVSTTHALGWGAIRRKYKDAVIDDDKAFKVIRRKAARWNLSEVDNIDQYIATIKKMVDLCRVTLTTRREFVILLGQRHNIELTDEDSRRILSVMEEMLNDTKTFDFIDMVYIPAIDKKIWLFPSDYVFVDECISGRNLILLKDNQKIKMIDLYHKHVNEYGELIFRSKLPEVLSFNVKKGINEYKKIKNIVYKGERKVTMVNLDGLQIWATPSHLLYTSEGWREVKDIKTGDLLVTNIYDRDYSAFLPDDEQIEFLMVYRLAYAMANLGRTMCKFRMYRKNNEKIKTRFISSITPLHVKSNKDHINMTEYSTMKFFFNHKQYTKEFIIKNLTEKQLAILYFLNGRYFEDVNKYGIFISTKNFDEMVYYKELFERRFNSKFDIKSYKKGLYLISRDQDWFFDLVSPFIPKPFKNLVPENYQNKIDQVKYNTTRTHLPVSMVIKVNHEHKTEDVFDIEVEDNHNFYVGSVENKFYQRNLKNLYYGTLVHNCQDYNRAQQFMLNKIIKKDTGRLISVGDQHQCQPTGTKVLMSDGNYKNIEDIIVGDTVVSYDRKDCGCFRGLNKRNTKYGYKILETAKRYINDDLIVVQSGDKISKYTYNHKCFAKFKNDSKGYVLYLMELNGYFRLGLTPLWTKDRLQSLTHRAKAEKAEKFWMLNIYNTKNECYLDEQYYSITYGIPQMIFTYRNNGNQNQENIDEFYSRFDKSKLLNSAIELLTLFNRKYEYPLWSKNKFNYFSKTHIFQIQACNLIPKYMEMIHYSTDNIGERRHGKNGRKIYTHRAIYKEINKIEYEKYSGYVYSLKVDTLETYIADGLLTHNSIYGFNGSDSESFNWFRNRENTRELPLTTSYRCAKRIIELAQTIVPTIRYKEDAEDGEVTNGSVLELAKPGDFVLARKNKPLVVLLFDLLRMNKTATIRGNDIGIRIAETVKQYKTIPELNEGLNQKLNELRDNLLNNFGIIDFRNDPRYVALEDTVEIIRFLMSNTKTIARIIEKLSLIFTDKPEGIILSTIHKSKGLEADTVFIIKPDEIRLKTPIAEAAIQERNLEYIAYTRAKNTLIIDREWTDERE